MSVETILFKLVGTLSIFICTSSRFPQIFKMVKTKKTNDISMKALIIILIGNILLQIYAIHFSLFEMVIPNILTMCLIIIQICLKCLYDRKIEPTQLIEQQNEYIMINDNIG